MAGPFGAYGKMPSAGDFFRIAPPPGFVEAWDPWLQQALLAGPQAFGGGWDAIYMSAPIWRFTLAAGVAGPTSVVGVVMPSVDRVGRRFPLTLACGMAAGPIGPVHFANDGLFEALEDLALAALDDGMTRDRLAEALGHLPPPVRPGALTRLARAGQTVIGIGASPLQAGLAAAHIGAIAGGQSLWSAELNGTSRLMLCSGLPGMAEIPALFDVAAAAWNEEGGA